MAKKRLVDPEDLVALGDIARLAGVQNITVAAWTKRKMKVPFPKAVARTSAGSIYLRPEIIAWLKATNRLPEGQE